jgi:L-ascorbate metabolism protein UlaG (beta-lactamase superfamily)
MDIDITFVGNATTVIRCGDVSVLTDPNFLHQGQRAYLGYGLVSRRLRPPAFTVDELPPVDAIVLSHMHGDHWDRVSQRQLDHDLPVLTTIHAAKRLRRRGFGRANGLNVWDAHVIERGSTRLAVTALPGRHAPLPVHRLLPPVIGTMLEFGPVGAPPERRLYVSGDTLLVEELGGIRKKFDSIDAGILHLGGTRLPAGPRLPFGLTVTMDGRQGADLAQLLELPKVIPVHFDDYGVFASPLSDFTKTMAERGCSDRVITVERGHTVTV